MISNISSGLSVTWFSRCTTFLAPIEKKRNWKSQGIDRRNKWEPRWHGLWSHVFKWQLSATYNCIWNLLGCSWQRCPCREVWPRDSLVGGKGNSCSFCLVKDHVPQRSSVLFLSYLTEASSGEALGSGKAMDTRSLATVWRRASPSTLRRAVLWTDIHLLCSSLPTDT